MVHCELAHGGALCSKEQTALACQAFHREVKQVIMSCLTSVSGDRVCGSSSNRRDDFASLASLFRNMPQCSTKNLPESPIRMPKVLTAFTPKPFRSSLSNESLSEESS